MSFSFFRWPKTSGIIVKAMALVLIQVAALQAAAQRPLYLEDHDNKPYYFGITLAGNLARFNTELHSRFLQQDSIMVAEPMNAGGFALGLLATTRLSNRFESRFNPQLMFTERSIYYKLRNADRDLGTEVT